MVARTRVGMIVLLVLLAGCLEAADAPTDPTPAPTRPPTPPIDEGTLFAGVVVGAGLADLVVPEGAATLEVLALPTLSSEGTLTLRDPAGLSQGACDALPCNVTVDAPVAGNWTLRYDVSAVGAEVHVRVALAVDDAPDDAEETKGARDLLYEGALDPRYATAFDEEHAFHVAPGYEALALTAVQKDGVAARFALVDPAGEVRATCGGTGACEARVDVPHEGLWRARHHRAEGSAGWHVEVHGLAADQVPPPSNYTAFDEEHTYPGGPGTNLTSGFHVRAGHRFLGWSVSFRDVDVNAHERPIALLRAPNGTAVAICQPGPNYECPGQHAAASGLWRVQFLGPAPGQVEASVFVFGPGAAEPPTDPTTPPTPSPSPPPPFVPPPEPATRYGFVYDTWPGVVGPRHDHVPFLSTAGTLRGEMGAGTVLRDPGGREVVRCGASPCAVDVDTGWAGVWVVEYPEGDHGFANLTFDEGVTGAAAVAGEGRFYTALDMDIVPFPAMPIQRLYIPPGWIALDANVSIETSAQDTTARVELRDPTGPSSTCFAWKAPCSLRVQAREGQHGIELHGAVVRTHVRIVVS